MGDSKQINVVVSEQQHERWTNYAEEIGESLSHLIRDSVQGVIDGRFEYSSTDTPEDFDERLSDIQQQNRELQSMLKGVERRVVNVESEIQPPDRVRDLANQLLQALPGSRGYIEERAEAPGVLPNIQKVEDGTLSPTTVDELSHYFDDPEDQIRDALDLLESETHMVQSDTIGGETCYWSDL